MCLFTHTKPKYAQYKERKLLDFISYFITMAFKEIVGNKKNVQEVLDKTLKIFNHVYHAKMFYRFGPH